MRMRGYEESGLECKITSDSCAKNYVVPFYCENLKKLAFNTSFAILTTSSVTNLHVGGRTRDLSQNKRTRCLWFFFLWFILLHHKRLFDLCYPYCLTHVNNSVSNDMVILTVCWFLL